MPSASYLLTLHPNASEHSEEYINQKAKNKKTFAFYLHKKNYEENLLSHRVLSPAHRGGGKALAQNTFTQNGITYTVTDETSKTVTVSGYDGAVPATLTIPETVTNNIATYTVCAIGESAFSGCTSLANLTLPNSITSIGESAFSGCTSLKTVTALSASPATLGNNAFYSKPTLYTVSDAAKALYSNERTWSSLFSSIEVISYTLNIGTAGYATFSAPIATTIPEGLTAYYASESTEKEITLTKITGNIIPAYQGVVIQGTHGIYTIKPSPTEGTKPATNLLSNTAYASGTTVAGDYVLAVNLSNKVGFYKAAVGIEISEHKAFYHPTAATANQSKGFTFTDDGLTGINDATIESGSTIKTYYNLNGTVESSPKSGKMYIVNGKTVILK